LESQSEATSMRAVCIERCMHGSEGGVVQSRPDSMLLPYIFGRGRGIEPPQGVRRGAPIRYLSKIIGDKTPDMMLWYRIHIATVLINVNKSGMQPHCAVPAPQELR